MIPKELILGLKFEKDEEFKKALSFIPKQCLIRIDIDNLRLSFRILLSQGKHLADVLQRCSDWTVEGPLCPSNNHGPMLFTVEQRVDRTEANVWTCRSFGCTKRIFHYKSQHIAPREAIDLITKYRPWERKDAWDFIRNRESTDTGRMSCQEELISNPPRSKEESYAFQGTNYSDLEIRTYAAYVQKEEERLADAGAARMRSLKSINHLIQGSTSMNKPSSRWERPIANVPKEVGPGPTCDQCKSKMILRMAMRGSHKGQHFWGCAEFPKCRNIYSVHGSQGVPPGPESFMVDTETTGLDPTKPLAPGSMLVQIDIKQVEKYRKLQKRADEIFRFLCGVNLQDHPIKDQREFNRLMNELRLSLQDTMGRKED